MTQSSRNQEISLLTLSFFPQIQTLNPLPLVIGTDRGPAHGHSPRPSTDLRGEPTINSLGTGWLLPFCPVFLGRAALPRLLRGLQPQHCGTRHPPQALGAPGPPQPGPASRQLPPAQTARGGRQRSFLAASPSSPRRAAQVPPQASGLTAPAAPRRRAPSSGPARPLLGRHCSCAAPARHSRPASRRRGGAPAAPRPSPAALCAGAVRAACPPGWCVRERRWRRRGQQREAPGRRRAPHGRGAPWP